MRLSLGLVAVALMVACGGSNTQRRFGFIEADPAFVDFGAVGVGKSNSQSIALRNTGLLAVRLESVQIIEDDRSAFRVSSAASTLAPGESLQISVTYWGGPGPSTDVALLRVESDADNARELLVNLKGRTGPGGTVTGGDPVTPPPPPPPEGTVVPALIGYGGTSSAEITTLNEVWGFDLEKKAFSRLEVQAPAGFPASRYGHAAAWDATKKQLVIFGGNGVQPVDNAVWGLDFTTQPASWKKLQTTGTPPTARQFVGHTFDAATRSLYVFGGSVTGGASVGGLFKLDLASGQWSQIVAANEPTPRSSAATLFEPATGRLTIAGGFDQLAPNGTRESVECYAIDLRAQAPVWTRLPSLPQSLMGGLLWTSAQGMNHFGGISNIGLGVPAINHDAVLKLPPNGSVWETVSVAGSKPEGRYLVAGATLGTRRFVFGGGAIYGSSNASGKSDLWEFDTQTLRWTLLAAADAPENPGLRMAATLVATTTAPGQ